MDASENPGDIDGEFGFVTLDRTHTMTSFEAYAKWAKALHFGLPQEQVRFPCFTPPPPLPPHHHHQWLGN